MTAKIQQRIQGIQEMQRNPNRQIIIDKHNRQDAIYDIVHILSLGSQLVFTV